MTTHYTQVKKRDGRLVEFDRSKITSAILRAMVETGEAGVDGANRVCEQVVRALEKKHLTDGVPGIEQIQDMVESQLSILDYPSTAKAYILYRYKRSEAREQRQGQDVPQAIKDRVAYSKQFFHGLLSEFVYYRTYSRWVEEEHRRETWVETVDRYIGFMRETLGDTLKASEYEELTQAIILHDVMPSMRLMQFSGDAARATNIACFNCAYMAVTELRSFAELMYLLMCGTGVGFSVESQYVGELPAIKRKVAHKPSTFAIGDSKEGWCDALLFGLNTWFDGRDVKFDYSGVRAAGARLKTMGGRASGPGPLMSMLEFARKKILAKQGKRLSNIDVHDICCKIGECVVVGGVRRSALISLSDLDDMEMRGAKHGAFYVMESQRMMANNSVAYIEKPSATEFMEEWLALAKSGSGERGIFNRGGLETQLPKRRLELLGRRVKGLGGNPCGEILLQSKGLCNLSEVVARPGDTRETLMKKVRLATILGTYQAMLTYFPYLSKEWKENCIEERLLGVSITGQWDCPVVREAEVLREMRAEVLDTNIIYSKRFGITRSTCTTCVKPSGTVSQLVDAASGIHVRHAPYYIRRVRIATTDPLFRMMRDQKMPYYPETGQASDAISICVLEFPVKSPEGAVTRRDVTALDQLEYWKTVKTEFTEHNPSATISVGGDEWIGVAEWVYKHWDIVGGLSFLPQSDHVYKLAPYEEISKDRYEEMCRAMPVIDFSQLVKYEEEDETDMKAEPACSGGLCEVA